MAAREAEKSQTPLERILLLLAAVAVHPWLAVAVDLTGGSSHSPAQRRIAHHFRLAERLGAETVTLAGQDVSATILDYDRRATEVLGRYSFDLGVMFGYMLIATEPLFSRYPFINDHPALPDGPIGTYQEVIAELMRTRAIESGCMMNLVTGDVDRGPATSFCRFPIQDELNQDAWDAIAGSALEAASLDEIVAMPLYADIRARGVARERPFLVETLGAIAKGALVVPPKTPLDLTASVERAVHSTRPV